MTKIIKFLSIGRDNLQELIPRDFNASISLKFAHFANTQESAREKPKGIDIDNTYGRSKPISLQNDSGECSSAMRSDSSYLVKFPNIRIQVKPITHIKVEVNNSLIVCRNTILGRLKLYFQFVLKSSANPQVNRPQ